jgi:hypothetical protein
VALAASQPPGIVHAEACGAGQAQGLLRPMLAGGRATVQARALSEDLCTEPQRTADAGDASAAHAEDRCAQGSEASRADPLCRKRAPRWHAAPRQKPTRADAPCAQPQRATI